jgi:hypothetical protein
MVANSVSSTVSPIASPIPRSGPLGDDAVLGGGVGGVDAITGRPGTQHRHDALADTAVPQKRPVQRLDEQQRPVCGHVRSSGLPRADWPSGRLCPATRRAHRGHMRPAATAPRQPRTPLLAPPWSPGSSRRSMDRRTLPPRCAGHPGTAAPHHVRRSRQRQRPARAPERARRAGPPREGSSTDVASSLGSAPTSTSRTSGAPSSTTPTSPAPSLATPTSPTPTSAAPSSTALTSTAPTSPAPTSPPPISTTPSVWPSLTTRKTTSLEARAGPALFSPVPARLGGTTALLSSGSCRRRGSEGIAPGRRRRCSHAMDGTRRGD